MMISAITSDVSIDSSQIASHIIFAEMSAKEIIKSADTLVIYGTHLSVDQAIDLLDAK